MSGFSSARPTSPGRPLSPTKLQPRQLFFDSPYVVDPANPEEAFPSVQLRDREKPVAGLAVSAISAYEDIDSEWIDHEPSFAPRLEKTSPDGLVAGLSTSTYNWDHSTKQRRGAPFADFYHVIRLPDSGPVEAIVAVADGAGWGDEARMAAAIAAKRACSYLCDTLLAKHMALPVKERPKLTVSRLSDYLHNSITDAQKAIVQDPFFLKRRIHEEPKGATTLSIVAICQLEQPITCGAAPTAVSSPLPSRRSSRPESLQIPLTPASVPSAPSNATSPRASISINAPMSGPVLSNPVQIPNAATVAAQLAATSPHTLGSSPPSGSSTPAVTSGGTQVHYTPAGPQPLGKGAHLRVQLLSNSPVHVAPDRFDRVLVTASVGNCGVFLRQRSGRVVPVTRRPSNRDPNDPGGLLGWVWGGKKGAYWPQEANDFLLDEPTDQDLVALFRLARNKKGNANYGNLHFSMLPCRQGDVLLLGSDGLFENLMRVVPPLPPNADPLVQFHHQVQYAQKQAFLLEELLWSTDRSPLLHSLRAIAEHVNDMSAAVRRKEEEASRNTVVLLKHSGGSSSSGSAASSTTPAPADAPSSTPDSKSAAAVVPTKRVAEVPPFGFLDHVTMVALRIDRAPQDDEELEITMRAHELYGEPAGVSPWDPRRMSKHGL